MHKNLNSKHPWNYKEPRIINYNINQANIQKILGIEESLFHCKLFQNKNSKHKKIFTAKYIL